MPAKSPSKSALTWMLILAGALLTVPIAQAQEEAQEETGGRYGSFLINVETWVAQPSGLGYIPARQSATNAPTRNIEIGHGTTSELRWEGQYELPADRGTLVLGLYKHTEEERLTLANESFVFEETLAHPLFAGVFHDTQADQFVSVAKTRIREEYLEFHRNAFRNPRVGVDWFVGWRRVEHKRSLSTDYFALSPGLPPVLPPTCGTCPNLDPFEDSANLRSDFEGRGATVGADLEFSLWRNKLVFDGGLAVTVMRGKTDASFVGQNAVYLLDCGMVASTLSPTCSEDGAVIDKTIVLEPPYDAFEETFVDSNGNTKFVSNFIVQAVAPIGVQAEPASSISEVYDVNIGFRWRALKWLEPFAGFRQTHYSDVGLDLRPTGVRLNEGANGVEFQQGQDHLEVQNLNLEGVDRINTSVTYEGFFFGVTFRLF